MPRACVTVLGVEAAQAGGSGGRAEHTADRSRVEAARVERLANRHSRRRVDDLVSGDDRGEQKVRAVGALRLGGSQRRRDDRRR